MRNAAQMRKLRITRLGLAPQLLIRVGGHNKMEPD